jgi:hypothetical protein
VTTEKEWVETIKPHIETFLATPNIFVKTGFRLPYALHVVSYRESTIEPVTDSRGYQTDLLIAERISGSTNWIPRVVIEFKLGHVTTHDALTYSAKAATHKNIHPYLRYGIIVGRHPGAVPRRLMRHGHQFDFMLTLASETLDAAELAQLSELIQDELRASQEIGQLQSGKSSIRLVHRKWITS